LIFYRFETAPNLRKSKAPTTQKSTNFFPGISKTLKVLKKQPFTLQELRGESLSFTLCFWVPGGVLSRPKIEAI
jgi:hypothetical protein